MNIKCCMKKWVLTKVAKILRLQNFFLIIQKFLHDAANITFCSPERPGYYANLNCSFWKLHAFFSCEIYFSKQLKTYIFNQSLSQHRMYFFLFSRGFLVTLNSTQSSTCTIGHTIYFVINCLHCLVVSTVIMGYSKK